MAGASPALPSFVVAAAVLVPCALAAPPAKPRSPGDTGPTAGARPSAAAHTAAQRGGQSEAAAAAESFNAADVEPVTSPDPEPVSASDIDRALAVADELERDGTYDAARRQLGAVAALLPPAEAGSIRMQLCATWWRQQDPARGRACYLELAGRLPDAERRALAALHAASLAVALGMPQGRQELARLVETAPGTDAARRAVSALRDLRREQGGATAEADYLIGLASQLEALRGPRHSCESLEPAERDLCAEALVEAGRIRLREPHQADSAARLLRKAERAAGSGVWLDDALLWLARALRVTGRTEEAASAYRRLLDSRESSWWLGSYASEHRDDALLELGQTLEQLGRRDEARATYLKLAGEDTHSRLADDAAFAAARIAAAGGAPDELVEFLATHPRSRHAEEARRLLERP